MTGQSLDESRHLIAPSDTTEARFGDEMILLEILEASHFRVEFANALFLFGERLFERVLPRIALVDLDNLLLAAHTVDGLVKGLRHPDWPQDAWQALHKLAMQLCQACQPSTARGR
mgnify:CR=1 FL=1